MSLPIKETYDMKNVPGFKYETFPKFLTSQFCSEEYFNQFSMEFQIRQNLNLNSEKSTKEKSLNYRELPFIIYSMTWISTYWYQNEHEKKI